MALFVLLTMFQVITPSQGGKFEQIITDKTTLPIIVGFKRFGEKELNELDPEKRIALHKIAHRSCVERCFGLDYHTITAEERKSIESFSDDIKGKMNFEVIPIKDSSSIGGNDLLTPRDVCMCDNRGGKTPSCSLMGCVFGSCLGLATGFAGGFAALLTNKGIFMILCAPAAASPICCCVSAEVCACAYYRCCAEREIWNFDNPKQ